MVAIDGALLEVTGMVRWQLAEPPDTAFPSQSFATR